MFGIGFPELIVILVVRRMTRPLRALAEAADGFGRGEAGEPLEPTGPDDIKRTTRAFNAMRERTRRRSCPATRRASATAAGKSSGSHAVTTRASPVSARTSSTW